MCIKNKQLYCVTKLCNKVAQKYYLKKLRHNKKIKKYKKIKLKIKK